MACLLVLVAPSCGEHGPAQERRSSGGAEQVSGSIVSTVNGHGIELAEVRALAEETGLSLLDSLQRLQAERLLIDEASRRGGFEADAEVRDVARRAAVQALLDAEAGAVQVSDAEVRAAYDAAGERFQANEKRRVLHVLARVPTDAAPALDAAARAYVASVIPELRAASDVEAFQRAHHGISVDGVAIISELLPPLAREGRLVKEFEDAMFSLSAPGVVAMPVRTSFGWHAIKVLEITPRSVTPYETAAPTLRAELKLERQTARVKDLVEQLRRAQRVSTPQEARPLLDRLEI